MRDGKHIRTLERRNKKNMCFSKKNKKVQFFRVSDEAVEFIRKYLLQECNVTSKIDGDTLDDFLSVAFDWETEMVDENGYDKTYDYPDKDRNERADRFVSEISGKWSSGLWVPDFDDLNKRLGLM